MKKTGLYWFGLSLMLLLTACGSHQPNLVHTHKPILNVVAALDPVLAIQLDHNSFRIKNKTDHPLSLRYAVTWYDKQGVTQLFAQQQTEQQAIIQLDGKQHLRLPLTKPTVQSVNYRLFIDTPQ
ncbi:uncharacterized protein YcfL [Volucribacter psittacicida]|uniref:Uncharacterized protein YcfL n=1 Tax=Volucribacter psittacicida TaxID=203482 RepID=A0A4R1G4X2_9PAST|nr:DUF1425 domain-containing protein [Volucribacter psittacicida]TCK01470.1 uncharacterized protein YcfL [Volucribacter psittacicida]